MSQQPEARVLVVDDEPNIVDVVTMALRFQGFAVESAGTGGEAIAAVSDFRPDLIVLDVMLPDMEGFDVAERLGAQRNRVPIIFLTARDATDDKIRGLTLGGSRSAATTTSRSRSASRSWSRGSARSCGGPASPSPSRAG